MIALLWWACGAPPQPCEPPGTQVAEPRAAGCIVVRDGSILMVQNAAGKWSIPAGYVEPGETSAAAAARETMEEAGISATAGPPVCAAVANGFVAHACTSPPDAQPQPDGKETRAARFIDRKTLRLLPLRFPAQRAAYLRALE